MIRPSMKPVTLVLFCLFVLCAFAGHADAFKTFNGAFASRYPHFGGTIHQNISSVALSVLGISEASFQVIDDGNTSQDDIASEKFTASPHHHFDDNLISQSMAYITSQRMRIIEAAENAHTDPKALKDALNAFGELLHSAQDFYSHTNYVEIALKANSSLRPAEIPIVDWNHRPTGLRSGYFWWEGYTENECTRPRDYVIAMLYKAGVQGNFVGAQGLAQLRENFPNFLGYLDYATDLTHEVFHADLNKDGPNEPEGRVVVDTTGITLHDYAFNLAVRETQRQWQKLEEAIRLRYPQNAAAIIRALKGGGSLEPRLVTVIVNDRENSATIAGARITLGEVPAVTNAEGRATMRSIPGRFNLSVSAQDYNPVGPLDFDVPEEGDVPERIISLVPQKTEIRVLVKDGLAEQPIAGAEVAFHSEERGINVTGITGGDGRALLRPLRGHWSVNTTATFYNRNEQTIDVGISSESLEIALVPTPVMVTVLVLDDARSQPIRSATVTIGDQSGTTFDDGEVSIALTAGSYQVVAGAFGYGAGAVGLTVLPGQPGRATIRLAAVDAAIIVRVVTGQGAARLNVAGASVTVGEASAVTGADGTARLKVPPGAVEITASRADVGSGQMNVEVPPAGGTFTVVLAPSWGEVQVCVLDDQTGCPVSGATVTFAGREETTNTAGVAVFRSEEEGEFGGVATHPKHLNGAFLSMVRRGETARTTVRLVPAHCVTAGDQNSCTRTLGGFCPCQVAGACGMPSCLYQAPGSSTATGPQSDTTGTSTALSVHTCGTTDERTRCGGDARECPCGSYGQCGTPSCVSPPCRTDDDRAECSANPEECPCGDYGQCGMPGCRTPDDTNPPTINPERMARSAKPLWRLKAGYPQPNKELKGYIANGSVEATRGIISVKDSHGSASWAFTELPDILVVGTTYTITLTSSSATLNDPQNPIGYAAQMGVAGNADHSNEQHGTKYIKKNPTEADLKVGNIDSAGKVTFVFEPNQGTFGVFVRIVGIYGGYVYEYEADAKK